MQYYLYLTQTDTTLGFVSQDASKIDHAKKRLPHKHYIQTVNSLRTLQRFTRVPTPHKNRVRRTKRMTFILPNGKSFRVIKESEHTLLLNRVGWLYSSSANLSGEAYDESYAQEAAEVIVSFEKKKCGRASTIYRLGRGENVQKIR